MSWIDYKKGIGVAVDITEKCNALCPQCFRTDINPGGTIKPLDKLVPKELTFQKFKKWFPEKEMENIFLFDMTCNAGDPVMSKHLYDISKYILETSNANISFTTNGSIRDEDWWWDYGVLCGKRLNVKFSVDGITQEMHEKYRVGTNLKKILRNMSSIAQTRAKVDSITILFQHNIDSLEEILKLAKEYGAGETHYTHSLRFKTDFIKYKAPDGKNYTLDKLIITDTNWVWPREHKHQIYDRETQRIECRYDKMSMIYVSADGIVWPCCFTSAFDFYRDAKEYVQKDKNRNKDNPFYKMVERLEDYSLDNKTLNEIMENPFYKKDLMESLEKEPDEICSSTCWVKR